MGSIIDAAAALAARLDALDDVVATHDPAVADANRPCVLVGPPRIDYAQRANSWPLYALSDQPNGSLSALDQLDQLVQAVSAELPVERADPVTLQLRPDAPAVPAYVLYVTT